jgi:TolB protein
LIISFSTYCTLDEEPEDSSLIAFSSERDGNEQIYVMNFDGNKQRSLSRNKFDESSPSWSQ